MAPGQLIMVVLVMAESTILGVGAVAGNSTPSQSMRLSEQEDLLLLQVADDAEITDTPEDLHGAWNTSGDLSEMVTASQAEDIVMGEDSTTEGESLMAGDEEWRLDHTVPVTTQAPSRLDVDDETGMESAVVTVSRCQQKKEGGVCRAHMPSWYYDAATGTCKKFIYGGCRGNDNRFPTKQHCQATCPDVVPCSGDPSRTCHVSESACMNTTCSDRLDAICRVTPCTCDIIFFDQRGRPVLCDEPTIPSTTHSTDDGVPEDQDGNDMFGSWKTQALIVIGIIALVGILVMSCVIGRRWRRRTRGRYTAASSKPNKYMQMPLNQAPEQHTDSSLSV